MSSTIPSQSSSRALQVSTFSSPGSSQTSIPPLHSVVASSQSSASRPSQGIPTVASPLPSSVEGSQSSSIPLQSSAAAGVGHVGRASTGGGGPSGGGGGASTGGTGASIGAGASVGGGGA